MRALALSICLSLGFSMPIIAQEVSQGTGAVLRGLEKVNGKVFDMELANGESYAIDRLLITLSECRYPTDNPSGEAYALLTITETETANPVFQGWMVASSPALNALEHPRYDVWVLRCKTE
ncbi:DUF2155 domain-containing protein [Roseovarius sp. 2305UL8-3]|uniref:DUF2155 domain-containing protein n=1 Tax=Roseovarius conchicola TaxID=3121636 RepID=UPI0035271421